MIAPPLSHPAQRAGGIQLEPAPNTCSRLESALQPHLDSNRPPKHASIWLSFKTMSRLEQTQFEVVSTEPAPRFRTPGPHLPPTFDSLRRTQRQTLFPRLFLPLRPTLQAPMPHSEWVLGGLQTHPFVHAQPPTQLHPTFKRLPSHFPSALPPPPPLPASHHKRTFLSLAPPPPAPRCHPSLPSTPSPAPILPPLSYLQPTSTQLPTTFLPIETPSPPRAQPPTRLRVCESGGRGGVDGRG